MTTERPISLLRCQAILPIVVVLPVPLTPTIISTAGSALRSIGARPPAATSARISIRRSRIATPSAGTVPASTSCSSFSTTAAVVGAPASARISASSSRSQVSSSMRSKRLAEISSVSAWRLLERLSRRRWKPPRRPVSGSAATESFALAREPRSIISCQLVAIGRRGYLRGRGAERRDRRREVPDDPVGVRARLRIGEEAEADAAVVAEDGDRQRVVLGEEADRVDGGQLAAENVERELRAGGVGHQQVEEAGRESDRGGRGQQDA